MRIAASWLLILTSAVVPVALVSGARAEHALLQPDDPAVVERGRAVYAAECAACHGAALEGEPDWQSRKPDGRLPAPPHDETGHTWHHSDDILLRIMTEGVQAFAGPDYQSDMPAYGGILPEDDIIAVLSFIKSTWPDDIRAWHDRQNATRRHE